MLKFKIIQELEPELLENIENYNYTTKNGKINLQSKIKQHYTHLIVLI